MPICSGVEATIAIRKYLSEKAPNLPQPFICCMTSFRDEQNNSSATTAGMDYFITKPIFKTGV